VWSAAGELLRTEKHPDTVFALAFSPDGKRLAVGCGQPRADLNGALAVWDLADWSETRRWPGKGGMLGSVAFSPDGKRLVGGWYSGAVEFRNPSAK